jgi:hypothetical protein
MPFPISFFLEAEGITLPKSSDVGTTARAERTRRYRISQVAALTRRLLWTIPCGALLLSACVKQPVTQPVLKSGGVAVLSSELAQHIVELAEKSPTFRAAWQRMLSSGVPISIGTETQLRADLPPWYRKNPGDWAGLTLIKGDEGRLTKAAVAVNVAGIKRIAESAAYMGNDYLMAEMDRVLIHEIYGHLAPVVEAVVGQFIAGIVEPDVGLGVIHGERAQGRIDDPHRTCARGQVVLHFALQLAERVAR